MSSDFTYKFPSPVGGAPFDIDFAPAILFSALYGLLVPMIAYRMINRYSRSVVVLGSMAFAIERVVAYALRAKATHNQGMRESANLAAYFQTTLNIGFISIANDVCTLLRALLVSTTFPTPTRKREDAQPNVHARPRDDGEGNLSAKPAGTADKASVSQEAYEDQPRTRFWLRQYFGILAIVSLVAVILGVVSGVSYESMVKNGSHIDLVQGLRYASTVMAFFMIIALAGAGLYALYALPRVPRWPVWYLLGVLSLLCIVSVYRLIVMLDTTWSLVSIDPESLNTRGAKIAFWIFHVSPEWLAAGLHIAVDVRRIYRTHWFGDMNGDKPLPE